MTGAHHAALNATLNGLSAVLIGGGFLAIKSKKRVAHRKWMLGAVSVSALFLVSYLLRVALQGTHRYPGTGPWKTIYLAVLLSHTVLAVTTVPLVLRAVYLAGKARYAEHLKVVRFAMPIWMYVSVTGVLVYFLLYHSPG
jgi:putative membrane protein